MYIYIYMYIYIDKDTCRWIEWCRASEPNPKPHLYCSMVQCVVAVCCRVLLQCVAVCYIVWQSEPNPKTSSAQCVAVCGSVLRCVAVCCSVLQCVAVCCSVLQCVAACCIRCRLLQYVAVCYSVLQCVAVCCSVLQCVAVGFEPNPNWSPRI